MWFSRCRTWRVVLGEYDLNCNSRKEQILGVTRVYIHPKWNSKKLANGSVVLVLHFGFHVFNIFCTLTFYRVLLRNIYLYFYHLSPDTQSPESNLCACTFVFVCEYTHVYACESECVFVLCNPPFPPDMTSPCCASLQRPN